MHAPESEAAERQATGWLVDWPTVKRERPRTDREEAAATQASNLPIFFGDIVPDDAEAKDHDTADEVDARVGGLVV